MKIKSIIVCGLLLLGVGAATTSCEDMLTADNNLVTTDLAPQDTVYQMMGIVQRMQKLADRTILLGEVRADLVDVDPIHASADIQELSNNSVSTSNAYNSPAEYYAVINSCNIYLAYVDSMYQVYGDYYYRKEIIATKCFRAWCYLELAKIYGEVPFVTEPVLTAEVADQIVSAGERRDMIGVLDFAIQDLEQYASDPDNNALRPSYGASWNGISWRYLFLPVRALLGELYLWRGSALGKEAGKPDFINAIRMYHDYLTYPGEELNVDYNYASEWNSTEFSSPSTTMYSMNFSGSNTRQFSAVLPLDTAAYFGTTSDLRALFNSTYANNYYASILPSERISNISSSQDYCFYYYNYALDCGAYYAPKNGATIGGDRYIGDLRLASVYDTQSNVSESRYNSSVNSTKQYILKWTGGNRRLTNDARQTWIYYYRPNILYLHLAEALNLAGFPETAFAVLAYGLTSDVFRTQNVTLNKSDGTAVVMKLISDDEFYRLCDIKSYVNNPTQDYDSDPQMAAKAANSFVVWNRSVFRNIEKEGATRTRGSWSTSNLANARTQIGIHSIGSGDTEFNEKYRLDADQEIIDQLKHGIVTETAPKEPLGYEEGKPVLSQEEWVALTGTTGTATAVTRLYNAYVEEYEAYPALLENYNSIVKDYEKDVELLSSEDVRTARQNHVRWLILQEEALEGAFEGTRFYDLLRYQMQDGKVNGTAATIQMPDSIKENYGATPRMEGKPWYLTLPVR